MPPSLEPVEIEWVGHKVNCDSKLLAAKASHEENYPSLTKDASGSVPYFMYMGEVSSTPRTSSLYNVTDTQLVVVTPSTFQPFLRRLANLTQG